MQYSNILFHLSTFLHQNTLASWLYLDGWMFCAPFYPLLSGTISVHRHIYIPFSYDKRLITCRAYLLYVVVERSKKCVDFTFTLYFNHVVICTIYYQVNFVHPDTTMHVILYIYKFCSNFLWNGNGGLRTSLVAWLWHLLESTSVHGQNLKTYLCTALASVYVLYWSMLRDTYGVIMVCFNCAQFSWHFLYDWSRHIFLITLSIKLNI